MPNKNTQIGILPVTGALIKLKILKKTVQPPMIKGAMIIKTIPAIHNCITPRFDFSIFLIFIAS